MKREKKVYCKGDRAITLIALIVTIIVLLILAGITISQLSNSGLFNNAKKASDGSNKAKTEEILKLLLYEWNIENATNGKTLVDFLNEKVEEGKIEYIEEADDGIEVYIDGFVAKIDEKGKIIEELQIAIEKPKIVANTLKATLSNGTEFTNVQEIGTALKIKFNATIEGGTITGVNSPEGATVNTETGEITYTTNGNETEVIFEIVGNINGLESKAKRKVSLVRFYELVLTGESLLKIVEENNLLDDHYYTAVVNGETYKLHTYNVGTTTLSANEENGEKVNTTVTYGNANDVATSASGNNQYAKRMVVLKVNGDLAIEEKVKLTTYADVNGYGGPKGMLIYCTGTLTNNGEISMTARGARAEGQDVFLWKNVTGENPYEFVPALGGAGGVGSASNKSRNFWFPS